MKRDKRMIQHKKQEHVYGCGLACVAMIADLPYSWVRDDYDELFGHPEWVIKPKTKRRVLDYGTTVFDLHCLLARNEIKSAKKEFTFKGWDNLPDVAILATDVKRSPDNTGWHWVVFDRIQNVVLDPWPYYGNSVKEKIKQRKMIRTDYKRMRPKFYVPAYGVYQ